VPYVFRLLFSGKCPHQVFLGLFVLWLPLSLFAQPHPGKVLSRSEAITYLNGFDPFHAANYPEAFSLNIALTQSRSIVAPLFSAGFSFPLQQPFALCGSLAYQSAEDELYHYFMLGAIVEPFQSDSAIVRYRLSFQKRHADGPLLRMRRFSIAGEIWRAIYQFYIAAGLELNLEKGAVNAFYPDDWFGMPYMRLSWRQSALNLKANGHLWSVSFSRGISI